MFRSKIRTLVLGAVCTLLFATPLGVSGLAAAKSRPHHKVRHAQRHSSGIPQHNGGDRDSDNNGAPSDGDGNL
jgi:hypothetical protein